MATKKNTLLERLQEPSSYAAFAVLFYMVFPDMEGTAIMEYVREAGTAVLALFGFLMKERK